MRLVENEMLYPVLDLREFDALSITDEVINILEEKMKNKSILFENGYEFNKIDLEQMSQLLYCLQEQLDMKFVSIDKK